ncbi:PolC-type DNA polymerase III [Gudongella sp. DL1XJH-153]|uniref:PolC-type DNA polymerase III n=1 Tax=Gudongella sp. DL1XJH-153 TaxID=3409804 RepID=UPI003BB65D15
MTEVNKTIKSLFPEETQIASFIEDLKIESVVLDNSSMKMTIVIENDHWITKKDKAEIKMAFTNKFQGISINVEYSKNKTSLDQDRLMTLLKKKIGNHLPSSSSWLEDVVLNEGDIINMVLPGNLQYQSVTRNGLLDELTEITENATGKTLNVDYMDFQAHDKFLYNNEIEERKILKEMMIKNPNKNDKKSKIKNYSYGKKIKSDPIKIIDIDMQTGSATIAGKIFQIETKSIKDNRTLVVFYLSDGTNSISAKVFLNGEQADDFTTNINEGTYVLLSGDVVYDTYAKEMTIMLKSIQVQEQSIIEDMSDEKRVELHLHTQMSSMDGVSHTKDLIQRAIDWGHEAIAITDHGIVQAFPDAMDMSKDIKIIYGVEAYMINDKKEIVTGELDGRGLDDFVVFDLETTGLSPKNDRITEIGAVKIQNGEIVDSFSQLINPQMPIPELITKLTGITDDMVSDKPLIESVLPQFHDFIEGSVLVAHNASFDMGFIREAFESIDIHLQNPVMDTLELSRAMFPAMKSHKLNLVAKQLKVELKNHHRAVDDAVATANILLRILELLTDRNLEELKDINGLSGHADSSKGDMHHVILLAKNQSGLKDLYKLISESHLNYFYRKPRMPKSLIETYRKDLIIGSACEAGELYRAIIRNKTQQEIREIAQFYDYLEIQPLGNNAYMVREGIVKNLDELKSINMMIYNLGKKLNKPVVATGDVHFLDPEDEVYRRILMSGQKFQDADNQPPLYFRTTEQMLEEFNYMGKEISREVVITGPNIINSSIDKCIPIPEGTFPPHIEGADQELREITVNKAVQTYGSPLPELVKTRLERELDSIIKNGYSVMYIIAQKLVSKSLEDGYLVGSRGSVGSSFAATMSGITEVNPLPPHYICPECMSNEFFTDGSVASGYDLPDKECPECGTKYIKEGQDIPFEVFLGFEGDKEPDIDLNFAGEYQARAHKYTEELFGKGKVFRAGTIGTIADKTAYGFVKKYFEERDLTVSQAEINRLLRGCTGIKRSSGQHPGGVMIVPDYKDIHDFTPIQYPADDKNSGVITTHFDYHAISGRILKLDILGHDVPSIIRMLEDITGVNSTEIPLDDKDTMELFTSTKSIGVDPDAINCPVGTLGIPEFGTKFVRQMLIETKPTTFSELVRISGLSHGTDVWINNAQELVKNKIAPLAEVISTREDIMLSLINAGLDKKESFFIMENVRKGKGLKPDEEKAMRNLGIPEWYIESCKKIKYMFPKAHAAAYVTMSFRIAYFKVHYPQAFYATYFTTKSSDFDADLILKGEGAVRQKLSELEQKGMGATSKEKNQITVFEVVLEMYTRGFQFDRVDLYESHSDQFRINEKGIIPPLKALEGVGENAARKIAEEREIKLFMSIEDLIRRGKATRPVIDALKGHGCLDSLPESNQISLFNI